MLKSKSRYYEYIDDDIVLSQAVKLSHFATHCILPNEWEDQNVVVMIDFQDYSEFYHSRAKRLNNRTFIYVPASWVGRQLKIRLLKKYTSQPVPQEVENHFKTVEMYHD